MDGSGGKDGVGMVSPSASRECSLVTAAAGKAGLGMGEGLGIKEGLAAGCGSGLVVSLPGLTF